MGVLDGAPGAARSTKQTYERIPDDLAGNHEGTFTVGEGLSEPVWAYNRNKLCPSCNGNRQLEGGVCKACDGTGQQKYQEVFLSYELSNGATVREGMNYRLSAPFQMGNGLISSPSKLYERFADFSGLGSEDAIKEWGRNHEGWVVPLRIKIGPSKSNKYLRVAMVMRVGDPYNPHARPQRRSAAHVAEPPAVKDESLESLFDEEESVF